MNTTKKLFLFALLKFAVIINSGVYVIAEDSNLSAKDPIQQNTITASPEKYTAHNKHKFYIYWGGNRDSYSKSDIHFSGKDHDFTIKDVKAHDRPEGSLKNYFTPGKISVPQTNFRIGYFISDHYNISLGVDHMKYVVAQNQAVTLTGNYPNPGTYGEVLPDNQVRLTENFLRFEHTNGLNYINTEISRVDDISHFFRIPNTDVFQINATEGIGTGFLYPKTDSTLLGKGRHDAFHIAGYGLSAKVGLNFTFFKYYFIQTELKGGYIDLPNIRTTGDSADGASQHFLFLERVLTFGLIFKV